MIVGDVMNRTIVWISSDSTLEEAAIRMRDENVGFLPVVDGDEIRGVVSDRDIVTRGIATGCDATECTVMRVMTGDPIFILETDSIERAVDLMKDQDVRRLIVLDDSNRACGVLSLDDLAIKTPELAGDLLKNISRGY